MPLVLIDQTWNNLEILFWGSFMFSVERNTELQQLLFITITFFYLGYPMTPVIPNAKACASGANVPHQNNLHKN